MLSSRESLYLDVMYERSLRIWDIAAEREERKTCWKPEETSLTNGCQGRWKYCQFLLDLFFCFIEKCAWQVVSRWSIFNVWLLKDWDSKLGRPRENPMKCHSNQSMKSNQLNYWNIVFHTFTQIMGFDSNWWQKSNDALCVSVRLFRLLDAPCSFRGHRCVDLKDLGHCSRFIPPLLLLVVPSNIMIHIEPILLEKSTGPCQGQYSMFPNLTLLQSPIFYYSISPHSPGLV